jgi:D-aminopeptidase
MQKNLDITNLSVAIELDGEKIDAIFAEVNQCHLPGAAVGIAISGKPVYRKGFGLANIELPVMLSPSIRMRIHSTTKHFACLAYMLLCEEGKAGIDDALVKYIPELHPVTRTVTVRQLMGNIGGLRDSHDLTWLFSGATQPVSVADLLSIYRDVDDVNFAPGTSWSYNNGGFLLLAVVIERITGQALEDVLRERIFEPVGMHDTLLRRLDTDFVPNSATMHMVGPSGAYNRSYVGLTWSGEGGMVSTVDDMLRWLAHMDAPWVGSAATWSVMTTPQTLVNGTTTGYGLGLAIDSYRGVETIHHAGGGRGANSQMLKVPAAGLDIAIMVNRHDVHAVQLADRILDACLPGLEPVKAVTGRPLLSGVFRSPTTGRVIQLGTAGAGTMPGIKEGQPIASIDGTDIPIELDDDGVLRLSGGRSERSLGVTLVGKPGHPTSIRLSDFGNLDDLLLVPPVPVPDTRAISGHYRSESTGIQLTILESENGPRLNSVGQFGSAQFILECLAQGIWRAKSKNPAVDCWCILLFDSDSTGLCFSTGRTRMLPFRRTRVSIKSAAVSAEFPLQVC